MNPEIVNILYNFLPEIIISLTIIVINVLGLFYSSPWKPLFVLFIAGISLAFIFVLLQAYNAPQSFYGGMLISDHLAYYGKSVSLAAILFIAVFFFKSGIPSNEMQLVLAIALLSLAAVSSSNLIMTFVSLELTAVCSYFLFSASGKSQFRYFVYGSVLSGITLFGITLLYGICGSFDYYAISSFLSLNPFNTLTVSFSVILIIAGLSFKMFLLPFNFFYPALSEKLPLGIFGLISIPLPAVIFVVTLRFFSVAFHDSGSFISESNTYIYFSSVKWDWIFAILGTISLLAGNLVVLWQYNLKRIVSFLIIGQSGFITLAMASPTLAGTEAMLFNVLVFISGSCGIFYCLKILEDVYKLSSLESLKGIGRRDPFLISSLIVFLASFAGFPLTAGFTGRLLLLPELFNSDYRIPFIVAVLSSVTLLFFVFKLANSSFASGTDSGTRKLHFVNKAVLVFLLIPVLFAGLFPGPVLSWIKFSREVFAAKIL